MSDKPKFAVLGAGHGGRAMAAYLAVMGCDVNLYNRTKENIRNIQQAGGIRLTYTQDLKDEIFPGGVDDLEIRVKRERSLSPKNKQVIEEDVESVFGELNTISSDIEKVLKDREVIMVTVPANAHKFIAKLSAPYLKDEQFVLLNPGRCFGAVEFYKTVSEHYKGKPPECVIGEAQSLIYACRYTHEKPREVRILGVKEGVDVASIPSNRIDDLVNLIEGFYPQFSPADNVLETSLDNVGGVFHVPIMILNAVKIDGGHNFEFYKDGVTESTGKAMEEVDWERLKVARAMGVKGVSARKWLHQKYGSVGVDLHEAIQNTYTYEGIYSPKSLNYRYLLEDVPTGLVPLSSLGKKLDVSTSTIDAFIHFSTLMLEEHFDVDFFKNGRTMENLGFKDKSVEEIKEFCEIGHIKPK
ncbi:MAG: NADP transhydrogenase subunit alpha [Nanoarchaeota archaeon]|nr:NADP transhydrogenase subunit alpha [Nanoarchaeota archaeon]